MLNLLLILVAILIIVLIAIVITLFNININYLSADKIRTLSIDEIGLIIENDFNN
jgi:ABC-type cobalt transport system substrate-binding protein